MMLKQRGQGARRAIALIGTATLALAVLVATGSAAQAAEDDPPVVANITGTEGTLYINKHAGSPIGEGNGQEITDGDLGAGVDGITFTIARVRGGLPLAPLDLTTTAGWDLAKTASDAFNISGTLPAGFDTVPAATPSVETAGGGLANATLPYGLYLVTEQPNPAVETIAQPFLVTLPYPSEGTWLYDVYVYPKNLLKDDPSKTVTNPVDVSGNPVVVEGSFVTWLITAPVPRVDGNVIESFSVRDVLDSRLKYDSVVVKVNGVSLGAAGADSYSANLVGADPGTGQGGTLTVTLLGDALADLQTGDVVTIDLKTSVHGLGEIPNQAIRNVNDDEVTFGTDRTNWGTIKVLKTNAGSAKLAGAKFEVYKSDKTTKVQDEQSTNGDGEILFDGLWVGNNLDTTETYCLKETQAPPGYITPLGDAAWTCVTVSSAGTAIKEVPLTNTQQTGPNLPLTGSTGTALFLAAGAALILAAGGAGLMAARRRRESEMQR